MTGAPALSHRSACAADIVASTPRIPDQEATHPRARRGDALGTRRSKPRLTSRAHLGEGAQEAVDDPRVLVVDADGLRCPIAVGWELRWTPRWWSPAS